MTSDPRPISIWHPERSDGELVFVRPGPGPFGDHYAATPVLRATKRRPRRLCLLGESVAAGYLLAPHRTPAEVLERRLGRRWEVVDLARTNERLETLAATAEAALQLSPDRLVVFAGNNWNLLETPEWSPYAPSSDARRAYGEALGREGLAGPVRAAAGALAGRVASTFERLAATGVPVTVVVPEVNLADWESSQPAPWLPGRGVAKWYGLLEEARARLAAGELEAARERVEALLALDGGSVPTGFRLLSTVLGRLGEAELAATAARAEVDTTRYASMALLAAPRATTTAQELAREAAGRHRFEVVDLPEAFRGAGRLPGRELFYDYCHLTPEGIERAMAAVAESIEGPAEGSPSPALPDCVRAIAQLGAAVHGAHRGAVGEPIRFWLGRAIATEPRAAEVLLDLVAARAAPVPAVLTRRQLVDPWLHHQHGWKWEQFDAEIVAAAGELLGWERVRPLLGPPRVEPWSPLDRFYPEAMDHEELAPPLHLRSAWPWTDWVVVAPGPVEVDLVARLPEVSYPRGGAVGLEIGGRAFARLRLGPRWSRHRLELPSRPGLGRLRARWPLPEVDGEIPLASAVERLEAGRAADVHPVFGEVLSLELVG